jgi:D-beta-D-heptose 7-phosphate kinase/D-beta-D-heptose 1-phosphate adenosyltransferase
LIEKIRPDILVKGQDYAGKWVCGREFVESYGGKVLLAPLRDGYSTTGLIRRVEGNGGRPDKVTG